jgi:hypothetical protein
MNICRNATHFNFFAQEVDFLSKIHDSVIFATTAWSEIALLLAISQQAF